MPQYAMPRRCPSGLRLRRPRAAPLGRDPRAAPRQAPPGLRRRGQHHLREAARSPRVGRFRHHQPAREEHGVPSLRATSSTRCSGRTSLPTRAASPRVNWRRDQRHFGSFDAFRAQLTEAAERAGLGVGRAVVGADGGPRLIVEQVYDHQGNVGQGGPPLLVLDMWEHAYYLQYKNVKTDWVDAYWHLVNWPDVATGSTT